MVRDEKLRALSSMTIDKWGADQKGASRARKQKRWSSTKRGIGRSSPFRVLVAPVIDRILRLVRTNTGGTTERRVIILVRYCNQNNRFPNTDLESK
jgi:hypothetical protein